MRPIRTLVAVTATALSLAGAAAADQPEIFGPVEYDAAFSFSNCGFPVDVSLHGTFENRLFVNPVRNINYIREEGTATNPANGATALVRHMYTEIGRPPTSPEEGLGTFATRGLTTRVLAPGAGSCSWMSATSCGGIPTGSCSSRMATISSRSRATSQSPATRSPPEAGTVGQSEETTGAHGCAEGGHQCTA